MNDAFFIKRCIDIARLGAGNVAPNPMVGAVLVYNGSVIGEGWHKKYGEAHAEVNCINSVKDKHKKFIPDATLYVSLEPCAHYGKTPPCADFIIHHRIKKVVIGCRDIFAKVNGAGIKKMQNAGVEVITGICEDECVVLNKRFFTFHQKKRPYVILKWAQTCDGFIGSNGNNRMLITNEITNRIVHKWRSEEAAIVVGTRTVLQDNPMLTNRYYFGGSPVRMFVDKHLGVQGNFHLLNNEAATIIFNTLKDEAGERLTYAKISFEEEVEKQILQYCFEKNVLSIIVEGGAKLLQSFIDAGLWDEYRVITNTTMQAYEGVAAPSLKGALLLRSEEIFYDRIDYYIKA